MYINVNFLYRVVKNGSGNVFALYFSC